MGTKAILMGNEAIARGIVEAGCEVACAYPGTPSSEILPSIAYWADELKTKTQVEWGANEKIAFETALGATFAASLGFMLPVSTPCNAIVYGSGYVPLMKMVKYGILLDIAGAVVIITFVWTLGGFLR